VKVTDKMETSGKSFQCVVVTPEHAILDESVEFVALPMVDGELGVLHGRAPLIGRLGFGELRLQREGSTQHYYVDGGFAQVRDNVVTVLTSRALRADQIDPETITIPTSADLKAQQRARAQVHVARRARQAH
jgi:F-type H+-transporting ATPase subunit epsilon